jgi:hypothetical protein
MIWRPPKGNIFSVLNASNKEGNLRIGTPTEPNAAAAANSCPTGDLQTTRRAKANSARRAVVIIDYNGVKRVKVGREVLFRK